MRRRRFWTGQTSGEGDADPPDPTKLRSAARNTAIGLLARREHAQAEIRRKLRDRGYDKDLTLEVVDDLTRQRLLSDTRFAEAFIRSRADRGQGPVRLKAELRQLKIPAEQIERQLLAAGMDWIELARQVRLRKFGKQFPASLSERAKQVRFLQYRGFTAGQIRAALGSSCEDELLEAGDDGDPPDFDSET
jgi:regulatory protein